MPISQRGKLGDSSDTDRSYIRGHEVRSEEYFESWRDGSANSCLAGLVRVLVVVGGYYDSVQHVKSIGPPTEAQLQAIWPGGCNGAGWCWLGSE